MSFLRSIVEQRALPYPSEDSGYEDSPGKWGQGMAWQPNGSTAVSRRRAMSLSTVFACIRILSEAIATVPVDSFRRRRDGGREGMPTPQWLKFDALSDGSEIDYLSGLVVSLLSDGNAFVATTRDRLGEILSLCVLDPYRVEVKQDKKTREQYFEVDSERFSWLDIMHIRGMCLPGHLRGISPIAYARESIGLGLSAQTFGSSFFTNGALPGAVLEVPGEMKPESARLFKDTWNGGHQGVGNANKIGVLTNGAKLAKVSVNPNDAQFLETRQFQVPDICRFFGVPPHLVADASNSTSWGSGLAEQNLAFGQWSLRPWVTRIDRAHTRLLRSTGRPNQYLKLNLDAYLRASLADRYASYAVAISNGFMTVNEARALEDLPPLPNGDVTGAAAVGSLPMPTSEGGTP